MVAGVEFPHEESRRCFQDRDILPQHPVFSLQPLDLRTLLAGLPVTVVRVDLSLDDPPTPSCRATAAITFTFDGYSDRYSSTNLTTRPRTGNQSS